MKKSSAMVQSPLIGTIALLRAPTMERTLPDSSAVGRETAWAEGILDERRSPAIIPQSGTSRVNILKKFFIDKRILAPHYAVGYARGAVL